MIRGRLIFLFLGILFFRMGVPLWCEDVVSTREQRVRRGAQITGAALGAGVITLYAAGPYTGFDFEDHPFASSSMVAVSSLAALGGGYLYSTLFADSIIKSKAKPIDSGFEGIFAGALAGGMTNGIALAAMFAIGVPSGVIEFNDQYRDHLDTWYKSASVGFMGGFVFGMFFGALAGAVGGPVISFSLGY